MTAGGDERRSCFVTPVYVRDLDPEVIDNDAFAEDILKWKGESDGIVRSNRNGVWHSENSIGRPAFTPLVKEVFRLGSDIFDREGYVKDRQVRIDEMWANVAPRGGYHAQHIHGGCLWSGVYYVKAPENSGELKLRDPRVQVDFWPQKFRHQLKDTISIVKISPKPGRLVMFPSWLSHSVDECEQEGERISVSFNVSHVRGEKKKEKPKDDKPVYVEVPGVLTQLDVTRLYSSIATREFERGETTGKNSNKRNNQVMFLDHRKDPHQWIYEKVREHAEIVAKEVYGIDIGGEGEFMQMTRYCPGEKYDEHQDGGSVNAKRAISCVIHLKNSERGGGLKIKRAPRDPIMNSPGDAVFFRSDEVHQALEVEEGVRDVLVVWFHHA